jgi:hypothetical protein
VGPPPTSPLFHVDPIGKTCFSEAEAAAACVRVVEMGLLERVKARLPTQPFDVTQRFSSAVDENFCNESV